MCAGGGEGGERRGGQSEISGTEGSPRLWLLRGSERVRQSDTLYAPRIPSGSTMINGSFYGFLLIS